MNELKLFVCMCNDNPEFILDSPHGHIISVVDVEHDCVDRSWFCSFKFEERMNNKFGNDI